MNPVRAKYERMKAFLVKCINEAKNVGEAITRGWLTALVDDNDRQDNATPEFLRDPATGASLEIDSYFRKLALGIEGNGPQHYVAMGRFDEQTVLAQRARDERKRKAAAAAGVTLVVVHAHDLSLEGMLRKLKGLAPLRSLLDAEPVIEMLEARGVRYRKACQAYPIPADALGD